MSDPIDSIVTVSITVTSATPTKPNFGTPAIMGYHTHNTDRIRTYANTADMVTDGFTTVEPLYRMASAITRQNPRPPTFKVIRSTHAAVAQTMTMLVTAHADGVPVSIDLTNPAGVTTTYSHTPSSESTAQVATALAATIDAVSDIAASATGSTITMTAGTAGDIWYMSAPVGGTVADTTATTTPDTDLDATILIDNDWYGISGEWLSATNIALIAAWAESNKKIHAYTTCDDANLGSGTGVFDTLRDQGYDRSYGQFSRTPITYGATGLMAQRLTADPGSDTWAYKKVTGTAVDSLTTTQTTNITGNNGNYYITIAGVPATYDGRASSGQFMDIQRGLDSLSSDIQLSVFTLLVTMPKLPYTRKGIALVGGEIKSALQRAVQTNFLSNDSGFEPSVSLPDIADISDANKAARTLPSVSFTCYAQGAIHKIQIQGTVNI